MVKFSSLINHNANQFSLVHLGDNILAANAAGGCERAVVIVIVSHHFILIDEMSDSPG